jgi:class 3 adenylate cyclase/tetratricopeptide (TPR) repeat protein
MDFVAVVDQVIALLRQRGRVTYRTLKRQFQLDEAALEDLTVELIEGQRLATDEQGTVLVWTGAVTTSPLPAFPPPPARAPRAYTPAYLAEKIVTSRNALEGERKLVTVLFADLKGSMELLADRDPDEARQLLDAVLERMLAAVHRYEGTVNQIMGDGIMALFGAPLAHEDHALRACYAALAMQTVLRRYSDEVRRTQGLAVHFRVGLNSGEVVVRAISNDLHMDYSAIGQTVHLAARMEQLATPGTILLPAATLRLVEDMVQVHALGPLPVKGLAEPMEVFELVGASGIRRRLQARAARGLTRFVGREAELETLTQALGRAGAGHGQVVAVLGEAGVGKSRLVYECLQSHRTQGWRVLESGAVSYGQATPYGPVMDLLKRYAHVDEHDDVRTIRAKVTGHVLTLDDTLQEALPPLLSLLEVLPEDSPFLRLAPPQRRQRTLAALQRLLVRESQVQPLLLVVEDVHWLDAETQALLDRLVERLPTARLLLLVTYRPEYQHGWGSKTYYTHLCLDALPPASAAAVLQALLGEDPSLAPLTPLLIARTAGNPFFLEESVRTLVETGVLGGTPGAYRLLQALPAMQLPATVQAMLAARIDRLPPDEKRLLQTAAVIGTEVPMPLLRAIAELSEAALHRSLAGLQAAEFLYETGLFPEPTYTFKHALTHEVAYRSLVQERRRALHTRLLAVIEGLSADRLADVAAGSQGLSAGQQTLDQVDRLAHHALRGEVWDKAVAYLWQAGGKAAARSANREAVTYYEQALQVLPRLPERRDTQAQAIDLRCELRHALDPLGELARVRDCLGEAQALAERLGDDARLGKVLAYQIDYARVVGEYDQAMAYGQRALALAEGLGDHALRDEMQYRLGQVAYMLGDYRHASDLFARHVAALESQRRPPHGDPAGLPAVFPRTWWVWCCAELGEFAAGMVQGASAVRTAEAAEHPYSRLAAYHGLGRLALRKGEVHQAILMLERGLELARIWQVLTRLHHIAADLGGAYALAGRVTEALPLLEQAVQQGSAIRAVYQAQWGVGLGESYRLAGRLEEARHWAARALEQSRAHGEKGHQAWALRLLASVAAQGASLEVEQAEAYYRQAIVLAEELGMRPLLAHCHLGLGTLYHQVGRLELARAALSTALALYRAMDMTLWLPQAETVLAQGEAP